MASTLVRGSVKAVIALAALGGLAVLFVRSADSSRSEPFTVSRGRLSGWRLELEPDAASGVLLTLRSDPQLATAVSRQVFVRLAESQSTPSSPAVPLVLRSEFERAMTGRVTPDMLLSAARAAGLEAATFEPRCLVVRRLSEPRAPRAVYFILFNAPRFGEFRQQVGQLLRDAGGDPSLFDPAALSPVLIVAALDGDFDRWLPLRVESDAECLAPIEIR